MFHLVKDVYLMYEEHLDYHEDCLYISKHDHYQYNENLSKILTGEFGEDIPKMYKYANSVDDLVDQFVEEKNFFKMLTNHKGYHDNGRLYIYCDAFNYVDFVVRWFKTILPEMEWKEAYRLYDMYRNRALYAHREFNILREDSEELHRKYWCLPEMAFEVAFSTAQPFNIKESVKEHLSLEYHLASYLCGNKSKALEIKTRHFYRKQLVDEICETKKDLERRLYFLSDQEFQQPNLEEITKKYRVIGDFNIKQSADVFNYLSKEYDMLELVKEMIMAHTALSLMHNREPDPVSIFAMQLYVDKGREPTIEEILDLESKNSYYMSIFFKMADHNKMNLFLLQEIFYLNESGKTKELERYCL